MGVEHRARESAPARYRPRRRDAGLQGAALRLFLRVVEQCLRAHSPDSGPAARLGAVACLMGSRIVTYLTLILAYRAPISAPTAARRSARPSRP